MKRIFFVLLLLSSISKAVRKVWFNYVLHPLSLLCYDWWKCKKKSSPSRSFDIFKRKKEKNNVSNIYTKFFRFKGFTSLFYNKKQEGKAQRKKMFYFRSCRDFFSFSLTLLLLFVRERVMSICTFAYFLRLLPDFNFSVFLCLLKEEGRNLKKKTFDLHHPQLTFNSAPYTLSSVRLSFRMSV